MWHKQNRLMQEEQLVAQSPALCADGGGLLFCLWSGQSALQLALCSIENRQVVRFELGHCVFSGVFWVVGFFL